MERAKYFWRVIMDDDGNENGVTVAMFILESDARKWAAEENKVPDSGNYSVYKPKEAVAPTKS